MADIDRHVDFYVANIYRFYLEPRSVFYMTANVEEGYLCKRTHGNRTLPANDCAHPGLNAANRNREADNYFVEAMAVVADFPGAHVF